MSRRTIERGLAELDSGQRLAAGRVRRAGAGRPSLSASDPTVVEDLERLVCPATRGDPERPLRWTSKSAAKLADGLRGLGHEIVDRSVLRLLGRIGYTMQANVKTREGAEHPDRDAQFEHINDTVAAALAARQPVISVDTKKNPSSWGFIVRPLGFEPRICGLRVRCSAIELEARGAGRS